MTESSKRATRGSGSLEPLLARLRGRRADACIPEGLRRGRLLDLGCGRGACFVRETRFAEKHGVDQLVPPIEADDVAFRQVDLNASPALPYAAEFFQVVTMLAVVEHLTADAMAHVFKEAHRVLVPGGRFILTTPAPWSDPLLRAMARIGLVSSAEIDEHQNVLSLRRLVEGLTSSGFSAESIDKGYFELGLNMWAAARK